jgi:hypothetical protein
MVKLGCGLLVAGLVFGLAGTALAGPVQVYGNWARGEMGSAHNAGGAQYIGCWINSDSSGPPLLYCEANDGAGAMNFCYSTNPSMLQVASTIQSSSELSFGWDALHACSWYTVSNFSQAPGRRP